jgi:outer membrane protein OmpA-like peptidoglycan-associated protein
VLTAALSGTLLLAAGCSPEPVKDPGADSAHARLVALQSDPNLGTRAPLAIKEAQDAVAAAETPQQDPGYAKHLAIVAATKVATAEADAQAQYQQDQLKTLGDQRDQMRLQARDVEAERLKGQIANLQASLQAKQTDRGVVFTLGDVLFQTNRAELKPGARSNLDRLVDFLQQYPDRSVTIEGHTDSTGSSDHNLTLSQERADSVRSYLVTRGIDSRRVQAIGKGQDLPVASNDTAAGRQANRRVEVIVGNPPPQTAALPPQ